MLAVDIRFNNPFKDGFFSLFMEVSSKIINF
jgi:hypothetical protein